MSKLNSLTAIVLFILSGIVNAPAKGAPAEKPSIYNIEVTIDPGSKSVTGKAQFIAGAKGEYIFDTAGLEVGVEKDSEQIDTISLTLDESEVANIEFRLKESSQENQFTNDSLHFAGIWFPVPRQASIIRIGVELPSGYTAITEAEEIRSSSVDDRKRTEFIFEHPRHHAHLMASTRYVVNKKVADGIEIDSYFYKEDQDLAEGYLDDTARHIQHYKKLIGKFPYKRFSVVEDFLQSGNSMPTFTLLGNRVLRLPFIRDTSLRHEVLHQWFGSLVEPEYKSGNWSEGLVTYLADHMFRDEKNEGSDYRRELLSDYEAYASGAEGFTLRGFVSRPNMDHRMIQSVGYGKTAMVFHMLHKKIGDRAFYEGLRTLIRDHAHSSASWKDIESIYADGMENGKEYFSSWLDRTGLPIITIDNAVTRSGPAGFMTTFRIKQSDPVYPLQPAILLINNGNREHIYLQPEFSTREKEISVNTTFRPDEIIVDPGYNIARRLSPEERPPAISGLIRDKHIVLVIAAKDREVYKPLEMLLHESEVKTISPEEIGALDLKNASVIFAGKDNPALSPVYGFDSLPDEADFAVQLRLNPWNRSKVAAVIHSSSADTLTSAVRRLPHYGRYMEVAFAGTDTPRKIRATAPGGIRVKPVSAPVVKAPEDRVIEEIATEGTDAKIVYLGEFHTSYAHHELQLEIIKNMYKKNPSLIIGMEMFQHRYQNVLDEFIEGKISEKEFLVKSEYFRQWGYDYNLYRPILQFAHENKIPLVALNLEREVIKQISSGGVHSLPDDMKKLLPGKMDFSDNSYREFLDKIFSQHGMGSAENPQRFERFLQSQIAWDESMAATIVDIRKNHPDASIAVIAGSGHIRFGRGIPDRVMRETGLRGIRVLMNDEEETGIADYVLLPEEVQKKGSPTLGVVLQETESGLMIMKVDENSSAAKAGLKHGDILRRVGDNEVKDIADVKLELFFATDSGAVPAQIERDGKLETITLQLQ